MSETDAIACLRCGDFARAGELNVPGLELCARCLEGERDEPLPTSWALPPSKVVWSQRWPVVAFVIFGFVVGLAEGSFVHDGPPPNQLERWCEILGFSVSTAGLAGTVGLALFYAKRVHRGMDVWRDELAAKLGLVALPRERARLILYSTRAGAQPFKPLMEYGILAVGDGGLAFFGAKGTRHAFPAVTVAKASVVRQTDLFPPQTALRLERAGGQVCHFRFKDGASWTANVEIARDVERRLRR